MEFGRAIADLVETFLFNLFMLLGAFLNGLFSGLADIFA